MQSLDWYAHHHEKDPASDNVILHVVWEHNSEVFRADNSRVPTLVLQSFVHPQILNHYKEFFSAVHQIIGTPIIRLKHPLQNE